MENECSCEICRHHCDRIVVACAATSSDSDCSLPLMQRLCISFCPSLRLAYSRARATSLPLSTLSPGAAGLPFCSGAMSGSAVEHRAHMLRRCNDSQAPQLHAYTCVLYVLRVKCTIALVVVCYSSEPCCCT